MNWTTVWELVKINILYSNPQALTALKKKQAKKPKANFSAYKSMLRNQIMMSILFLFIYVFMFVGVDFSRYPGYFSFYIALFFVMSTITAFTALYTIFYESNDVKLYVHLPIKASELYLAKIFSSVGMGSLFLMPLLSLYVIAYWQMKGLIMAIPMAIIMFLVTFFSSNVIAIYLNAWIGKIIVRSPRRKLISTLLLFLSSIGAIGLIFFLNATNNSKMMQGAHLVDRVLVPYFRGFYDVMVQPFGMNVLIHFWLPLALLLLMAYGIVTGIMPKYYQEALYTGERRKQIKVDKKGKTKAVSQAKSLKSLMIKHHLSTLQDSNLLIQTYLMPLIFVISFMAPIMNMKNSLADFLGYEYFGVSFLVGGIIAAMATTSSTFIGVGLSLERDNFTYIKSLPIPLKAFVREKFYFLLLLQISVPVILYIVIGALLGLHYLIILTMVLGLILVSFIQGQYMYMRDIKYLTLDWQNLTQLFTRGGSQWLTASLIFGSLIVGLGLVVLVVFLSLMTKEALLINSLVFFVLIVLLVIGQFILKKRLWDRIESLLAS
ncbi:ABC transporter permease [Streptococcus porcinus]|uniref:ABC transporter permease n=1 Tax=Streptococcus porcinus TaxID=1340 RepID=UPI0019605FBE|nr:ABC transporter permease [Streptococcus porcinus]